MAWTLGLVSESPPHPRSSSCHPEAHIITEVFVFYKKSRGVTGIAVTPAPGELAKTCMHPQGIGYLDGRSDSFPIEAHERLVHMELLAGIVVEQIRWGQG